MKYLISMLYNLKLCTVKGNKKISKQPKFESSNSKNKLSVQLCISQKVWRYSFLQYFCFLSIKSNSIFYVVLIISLISFESFVNFSWKWRLLQKIYSTPCVHHSTSTSLTSLRSYIMVIQIVEFSSWGYKFGKFLPKNQHTQMKLLNFENWCNGEVLKIFDNYTNSQNSIISFGYVDF